MNNFAVTKLKTVIVQDGVDIFYREGGAKGKPALLLLHGYPSSSFYFRNLIPILSKAFHVIAPDLPGFGFTEVPSDYTYNFANFAKTIESFVNVIGFDKFSMYLFDYGAPTGLRMARSIPERIEAIITQNGNAYEVGLGDVWAGIQSYWKNPSPVNREAVRDTVLGLENIKARYLQGVPNPDDIAPETYTLDAALTSSSRNAEIQLDLFLDYGNNVAMYPEFQVYLRKYQPPVLAIWGGNDVCFVPPGAHAYKKDVPSAEIHFVKTGHFALYGNEEEIGRRIIEFYRRVVHSR